MLVITTGLSESPTGLVGISGSATAATMCGGLGVVNERI
jgi:hypothetical protein